MGSYRPFICRECKPHRLCQNMGYFKHDWIHHKRKTRCLVCPTCGTCDAWWEDFRRHLFKSHGIKDVMETAPYMREDLPVFHSLHKCPSCWFRHYDKSVVDKHASTCGTADIASLRETTSGATSSTSQNSTRQRETSSPAPPNEQQTTTARCSTSSTVARAEARPGEMVGVGARRKTPNRQMRPVALSDSSSNASTNTFAEVASVLYKDTAQKTFTSDRDRDAQRLADNTAAAGFLREQECELDALRSQLNAAQAKLAAPRAQTVYWPNVQHPVYSVAYVMPRNKQMLDLSMGCIVFKSLPAYGKYDAVMTDGTVLYRCMVDTHSRNLDERVPENQMVTSREDYCYMGTLFSCTGPWTLLGMFYISIIRRSGFLELRRQGTSTVAVQATFVPPYEWSAV